MSYLTDAARAPYRANEDAVAPTNPTLEEIVAANPNRRTILRGAMMLSAAPMLGALTACGTDDDNGAGQTPTTPTPPTTPALSYEVSFTAVPESMANSVVVPTGYVAEPLLSAGEPVEKGAVAYSGSFQSSTQTEGQAGGNHDGMHYFEIQGVDPNAGGLLVINHEYPDFAILMSGSYNATTATAEQKKLALSAVGVSVVEIAKGSDGKWTVRQDSNYNKRYTGNSQYRMAGPASGITGQTVIGTLNNCANGWTPWGTYLTCEETTDNYLDPTQPDTGYGWVVEIDPYAELPMPTKRTAMGRFDHENVAYLEDSNRRTAFYMGDDSTPGCIYKFVPNRPYNATNRAANFDLLDYGTLYVARFNANGSGDWLELTVGKNGLTTAASDPGNYTQSTTPPAPTAVSFATQADVLLNTKAAARVAGGTLMDRPEWISVGPDKKIVVTLTNNSSRAVTDAANPRIQNRHGHIIRFQEAGDSPLATTFTWEMLVLAGDPELATAQGNLVGNITGDTYSSPDGIDIDPKGRLWIQTDHSVPGSSGVTGKSIDQVFGYNAMFYMDQASGQTKRFLVGPEGCEITGLTYTPDLTTFFINIQHPTREWPSASLPARSTTIAVRRTDGKPVGA